MGEEFSPILDQLEAMVAFSAVEQMGKENRVDDAIAEIEEQRETGSEQFAPVWDMKLVKLLVQQNQYEEAAAELNGLMDDLPPEILNQMAWGIYEHASSNEIPAKLVDAAIAATEKALEETPDNGATLDTLAHLLHHSGDLDRAIEVQTKAMENPGMAEPDLKSFLKQLLREKKETEEEDDAS